MAKGKAGKTAKPSGASNPYNIGGSITSDKGQVSKILGTRGANSATAAGRAGPSGAKRGRPAGVKNSQGRGKK